MSFMKKAPDPPHRTIQSSEPTHVIALHPRQTGAPGVAVVDIWVKVAEYAAADAAPGKNAVIAAKTSANSRLERPAASFDIVVSAK
jgi:hypothetical protein